MQDIWQNGGYSFPWWRQMLIVLGFIAFYFLVGGLLIYFAENTLAGQLALPEKAYRQLTKNSSTYMLLSNIINFVVTLGCIWVYWKVVIRKPFAQIGFEDPTALKNFFLGAMAGIVAISLGFGILKANGNLQVLDIQFDEKDFFNYFLIFILVSVGEELMTRGLMLHSLMLGMNKYLALLLVAFIFGALHLLNDHVSMLSFLNVSLAGLFLGISYVHNWSLYFPIGLHLTWNFFQGAVYGFEVSGHTIHGLVQQGLSGHHWLTGGSFGFEGSLLSVPIMLLGVWIIHVYYSKQSKVQTANI
jgi:uncharacterized protein